MLAAKSRTSETSPSPETPKQSARQLRAWFASRSASASWTPPWEGARRRAASSCSRGRPVPARGSFATPVRSSARSRRSTGNCSTSTTGACRRRATPRGSPLHLVHRGRGAVPRGDEPGVRRGGLRRRRGGSPLPRPLDGVLPRQPGAAGVVRRPGPHDQGHPDTERPRGVDERPGRPAVRTRVGQPRGDRLDAIPTANRGDRR